MKKSTLALSVVLIAYTIYQVWLNGLFPYINDDFFYRYIVMYNLDQPITSVKDIIYSQYLHYNNINGRSIIHAIEQFVLWLSPHKQLFNILNAGVWTTLLAMIVIYATERNNRSWVYWILAIIYLRFLSANSSYLAFWASGSFNYYWTSVAALSFLFIYRRHRTHCATYLYPLYFIMSVLIGWSHETLITGIIVATIVEYILQKQYKCPLPTVILAGLLIGYGIMFVAPGNFVKLAATKQEGGASFIILALATAVQFKMMTALALMLCYGYIRDKEKALEFVARNRFLVISSVVNMLFCMTIGVGGRAIFFAETMAFIVILRFLSFFAPRLNTAPIKWMLPALVLLIAYETCYACDWKKIYTPINNAIERYIENKSGNDYIISDIEQPSKITAATILSNNQFWIEQYDFATFSAIHGHTFRILPAQAHRLITDGSLCIDSNRLQQGLPFYTTDSIDFLVMPCDTLPTQGQYIFNLHTPSQLDPDINLMGKLRRKIAPGSYPTTFIAENYSANPALPFAIGDKYYIILHKPPYRRVESVYIESSR